MICLHNVGLAVNRFVIVFVVLTSYIPLLYFSYTDTEISLIEETFKSLTERQDIGIVLINQTVQFSLCFSFILVLLFSLFFV
jgi:hypothetical protein